MDANRFFSVAYDVAVNPKLELLRHRLGWEPGDGDAPLGSWVALLSVMYDTGDALDTSDDGVRWLLMERLGFSSWEGLSAFLDACAAVGLILPVAWDSGMVWSHGVQVELDYKRSKVEAGRKSGEARRKKGRQSREQDV